MGKGFLRWPEHTNGCRDIAVAADESTVSIFCFLYYNLLYFLFKHIIPTLKYQGGGGNQEMEKKEFATRRDEEKNVLQLARQLEIQGKISYPIILRKKNITLIKKNKFPKKYPLSSQPGFHRQVAQCHKKQQKSKICLAAALCTGFSNTLYSTCNKDCLFAETFVPKRVF